MSTIYTVGHSTRDIREFCALLTFRSVELLVDVRQFAGSRRYPHFGAEALAAALEQIGIAYRHEPSLGGRRRPQPRSVNGYWQHESFRAYADYMATAEFRAGLEHLIDASRERTTAIMCAEAVPWRCHRQLIADALVARGITVEHILSRVHTQPHVLNPHARVQADGHLIYPAAQGELFSPRD